MTYILHQYMNCMRTTVLTVCTFSRTSMSLAKCEFQIGVQYYKVCLTNVLYNIKKDDFDKNLNDLLSCPSI